METGLQMDANNMSLSTNAQMPVLPGLRAMVWIQAQHFFSRADAQRHCWLWLVRSDGRVQAVRLDAARHGCMAVAADIAQCLAASPEQALATATTWLLPAAPVVPQARWAVSWGHPVQHAIRSFAENLDAEVMNVLGSLEVAGAYFGSVENYNRLALLPEVVRRHRLQALTRFPALVAPLLLELDERPDMFGTDEDLPSQRLVFRQKSAQAVLEAMDQGRDLIGALAAHYRIDRALVRSPLCRDAWREGQMPHDMLRLLNAMPAHARPLERTQMEAWERCLHALPVRIRTERDVTRLAAMFKQGWSQTWLTMQQAVPQALEPALRDSRDFLRAVLEQVAPPAEAMALDVETLGLAWLVRRGGVSLLHASRRWHVQPLAQSLGNGMPEAMQLTAMFGTWASAQGQARELICQADLIAEGDAMHHCVGGYWEECWLDAARIVHLVAPDGARATAMYVPVEKEGDVQFVLEQLRGPCNAEVGEPIRVMAAEVATVLNAGERSQLRRSLMQEAALAAVRRHGEDLPRQALRRLDLRSRQEAQVVLDWCARQANLEACTGFLYRGTIAGLAHAEGVRLISRLHAGDALHLAREPMNPHDARAVRIEWRGSKLGYVPRAQNAAIARCMDAGVALVTRIVAVHPERGYWNAVEIEVLPLQEKTGATADGSTRGAAPVVNLNPTAPAAPSILPVAQSNRSGAGVPDPPRQPAPCRRIWRVWLRSFPALR